MRAHPGNKKVLFTFGTSQGCHCTDGKTAPPTLPPSSITRSSSFSLESIQGEGKGEGEGDGSHGGVDGQLSTTSAMPPCHTSKTSSIVIHTYSKHIIHFVFFPLKNVICSYSEHSSVIIVLFFVFPIAVVIRIWGLGLQALILGYLCGDSGFSTDIRCYP